MMDEEATRKKGKSLEGEKKHKRKKEMHPEKQESLK
jgi:hypothetical protein